MTNTAEQVAVDVNELVQLCAIDGTLFGQAFFPKTVRQAPPAFHYELDKLLDSTDRYVSMEVFRGGAKTTKLRLFMARRIAYGISRTILIVGKSQGHASRSLIWLKKQIEHNLKFSQTFGLERGSKWNDEEIEIVSKTGGFSIWIVAFGVTGSTRGLNFDDYRPDLIIVDDVVDEENSASIEQRTKIEKLVLGALKESLTPPTENEFAKLVILQTPQDEDDICRKAARDPQFKSARFGCWTPETEWLPIEQRESIWPERFTTKYLQDEWHAALARNTLSIFAREMECKLIVTETALFREEWIRYFGEGEETPEPPLHEMVTELIIDPVPPPSDREIAKGLKGKDFEVLGVVGRWRNQYYMLELVANHGHDPGWTVTEFFRLAYRWNIRKAVVEAVAYQRTLQWLLREAMKKAGRYYVIEDFPEKRKKYQKIPDALRGPLSMGQVFVRRSQTTLCDQIVHFGPGLKHDDEIEVLAVGITSLTRGSGYTIDAQGIPDESEYEEITYNRGAP